MEAVLGILFACLALAGILLCVLKPKYAILPVILLFPIEQNLMGYLPEIRYKYGWLTNVIVGMIAVSGVAYHFFKGEKILAGVKNRVYVSVLVLYTYSVVSIIWTPSPDSAWYFMAQAWPYFILWYLVSPLLTTRLEDLESIVIPLIFACALLMALMLINPKAKFVDDRYVIDLGYQVGIGTLRSNPLAIADAGAALAITAALYRPNKVRPALTVLQVAAVLLGLALALLSGSRGQVITAVGLIAVLLPFVNRTQNIVRVVGGIIVVFIVVGFLYFVLQNFVQGAAADRWTAKESSQGLGMRFEMASAAITAYFTHPVYWATGLGAAAFNEYFPFRTNIDPHWYPHNILIEALTEYGVPGAVLMGVVLVGTLRNSTRLYQAAGDNRSLRTTVLAFAGTAALYLVMSCKQGAILGTPPFFMYCIILSRVAKNEELAAAAAENEAYAQGYEEGAEELPEGEWRPSSEPEPV